MPRVALLIESSREYGRGLLRGIMKYTRTREPWVIFHEERGLSDASPEWLRGLPIDGIIARADSLELCHNIERLSIPTVDLRGLHKLKGVPLIETNDRMVMRLAFNHLAERKFERFAFCGYRNVNYSDRRHSYAMELCDESGAELRAYQPQHESTASNTVAMESLGATEGAFLADWIKQLPKPVGVVCCNDIRGRQVLAACSEIGVHVPDEVAVIGVDNDEILCGLCNPPLSSVEPNTEKIGFRAAELLAELMQGQHISTETEFVDPIGVAARGSTDACLVDDEDVAAAIRHIRDHACEGITVDELVSKLPISRTVLEKRFAKHLGIAPKSEINRVRLLKIKQLLTETNDTLPIIAAATGFRHSEYMSDFFRRKTGETPGAYRKRKRP